MKFLSVYLIFVALQLVSCDEEDVPASSQPSNPAVSNNSTINNGETTSTTAESGIEGVGVETIDFSNPSSNVVEVVGFDSTPGEEMPVNSSGSVPVPETTPTDSGTFDPSPSDSPDIERTFLDEVKEANVGQFFYSDFTITGNIADHIVGGVECPSGYSQLRVFPDCTSEKCQGHRKLCERKFKFDDIGTDGFNVVQDVRIVGTDESCGDYGYTRTIGAMMNCSPNAQFCQGVRTWCAKRKTIKDFNNNETFITDLYITPMSEKRELAFCPAGYQWHVTLNGVTEKNWITDREHPEGDFLNSECQKMRNIK